MTYDAQAIFYAGIEMILDGFIKGYVLFVLLLMALSALYGIFIGGKDE